MGRVLVTGAAGFIGSHVADALIARGHEVHVLDDLTGGFRENVPAGAQFVQGTIVDADAVERIFARVRPTHVYHLAAYAAEGLSHFIKRFNYTNNVIGSVNLLNASVHHGVDLFVFASSIAVRREPRVADDGKYGPASRRLTVSPNMQSSSSCAPATRCSASITSSSAPTTCSARVRTSATGIATSSASL